MFAAFDYLKMLVVSAFVDRLEHHGLTVVSLVDLDRARWVLATDQEPPERDILARDGEGWFPFYTTTGARDGKPVERPEVGPRRHALVAAPAHPGTGDGVSAGGSRRSYLLAPP